MKRVSESFPRGWAPDLSQMECRFDPHAGIRIRRQEPTKGGAGFAIDNIGDCRNRPSANDGAFIVKQLSDNCSACGDRYAP